MSEETFFPTRAVVIHDIVRALNTWGGFLPSEGIMGPRTFALLALDYSVQAGVSDATLYAAGVPVTANEGMPEGALRLFRRGDAESMQFTHYRTDSWMAMYA